MKRSRKNALSFMGTRSYYRECRAWFWEDDDPLEEAYEAGDCEQYASLIGLSGGTFTEGSTAFEIGGDCDYYGEIGFYDCDGNCYHDNVMEFAGDQTCHDGNNIVATLGDSELAPNFNCEEFSYDYGDC